MSQRLRFLAGSWYNHLEPFFQTKQFKSDMVELSKCKDLIPTKESNLMFKAFRTVPLREVKVVIIGSCPYHGIGQFDGLAFSNSTLKTPQASLKNILTEVDRSHSRRNDLSEDKLSLYRWADQGVLLLNASHSVLINSPGIHIKYWLDFTYHVCSVLGKKNNIVFLLWGDFAHKFERKLMNVTHKMIKTSSPSPYSANNGTDKIPAFIGSNCFIKANEILKSNNLTEINW